MLCPACGDRAVTQPRLGMCNVCFADMQLEQKNRQNHRADQVAALTKVKAREDVRSTTAYQLREVIAGRMHATELMLNRAATILEGNEDVLLVEAAALIVTPDQPASAAPDLDEMISAFVAPLDQDRSRDRSDAGSASIESSGDLIIVHGGIE